MTTVHTGARLDRLPVSPFHYRLLWLIGAGMFLDGFEVYLQGGVLAALVGAGWSTPALNANFISSTFAGMLVGSWLAGVAGDRYGRRFAYQFNLLVFGLAALAGAAAPSMDWLIAIRFVMGVGLGAEIVVGYVTISEFVPPKSRGRWGTALALITSSALFVSTLAGRVIIPNYGWRWMFVIVGVGALIVWFLRRRMPESPRWLESKGHLERAEAVMAEIEREVTASGKALPPIVEVQTHHVASSLKALFQGKMLMRTIIGCILLITMNTALYGLIGFLPTFMVKQGITVVSSLNYATLMTAGGPVGGLIGVWLSDFVGRKKCIVIFSILAAAMGLMYPLSTDPSIVTLFGFLLVTCCYVLVAVIWALYLPELFPTVIRMRGAGFCNTIGRLMTILTPQLIVPLFTGYGVMGVVAMVASLLLLQAFMVAFFGIETKEKSLESLVPARH